MKHLANSLRHARDTFVKTRILRVVSLALLPGVAIAVFFSFSHKSLAVTRTWDGGGLTNNWSEGANWSGDVAPDPLGGDFVIFDGTSSKNVTIDVPVIVIGFQINSPYSGVISQGSSNVTVNGASSQSSGTFTGGSGVIDFNGNFTQSGGTFTASSTTTSFAANFTQRGTFAPNGGTVVFDGGGDTVIDLGAASGVPGSLTLNNVTVNKTGGGGRVFISGDPDTLVVAGTLTLTDGQVIGDVNATLEAQGDLSVASTFDGGSVILLISGAATRTVTLGAGALLPRLTVNAPNVTVNTSGAGAITFPQTVSIQSVAVFTNGAVDFSFSAPFFQSGGTFTGGSGLIDFNSNFTLSGGTFTGGSGLIDFNSNFTLSGGTFTASSTTTSFAANFTPRGTFAPNGGTVVFDGGGDTVIDLGAAPGVPGSLTLNNVTVNKTGGGGRVFISGDPDTLVVAGTLTLTDGQVIGDVNATLEAQGDLSIASTFDGGSVILLISAAATRTVTLGAGALLPRLTVNAPNVTVNTSGAGAITFPQTVSIQSVAVFTNGAADFSFGVPFFQSGGTFTGGSGLIDFNSNFTLSGGTFTASSTTTSFASTFTPRGTFAPNGGTVVFDGGGDTIIDLGAAPGVPGSLTLNNVTVNKTGGGGRVFISGDPDTLVVAGTLTLTDGQVNDNGMLEAQGDVAIASTFDGGTVNFRFGGSADQTYTNNGGLNVNGAWTIDKSSGTVNLAGNLDLSNSTNGFNLTNGTITTSMNVVNAGTRPVTRTSGHINGNLQRSFTATGTKTFDVGSANGYSPVTVNVTTLTTNPSTLTVGATQGAHPLLNASISLGRFWTLTEGGNLTATVTFNYLDPLDIQGNETNYRIIRVTGGVPVNFPNICPGISCVDATANTATLAGVTEFSDWTLGEPGAPTAVALSRFNAVAYDNGTMLEWRTGFEVDNLGFNVYREEAGRQLQLNKSMVAGSALVTGVNIALKAGRSYSWPDKSPGDEQAAQYWLEAVDLKGESTWHGPVRSQKSVGGRQKADFHQQAAMLGEIPGGEQATSSPLEAKSRVAEVTAASLQAQAAIASQAAAKIAVKREGWYRVTQPELSAVGFNTKIDPRLLQLFVDGRELPILVQGDQDTTFDVSDSIEFYGVGLDSPFTDSRVYWLVAGNQAGLRVNQVKAEGAPSASRSFIYTVERRDRTVYFSSLRNGEKGNFFGAVIIRDPVEQELTLSHLVRTDSSDAQLEIRLQGATLSDHRVRVDLNGTHLGEVGFSGQSQGAATFNVSQSLLREGGNVVRLTPLEGQLDVSLVDYLRISYERGYTADSDALKLTAAGGQRLTIDGFTSNSIRVIDVTDANAPQELMGEISQPSSGYAVTFASPAEGHRALLAFAGEDRPADLTLNQPSKLLKGKASFIIITTRELADTLKPFIALREAQGLSVALVNVEDIYDEFSFGQKTPFAVRDFLAHAKSNWKKKRRFILFAGKASHDPKNYLGFGDSDLVPTRLIDTDSMETSSDDWFSDFDGDAVADIATGRLPARTAAELSLMVEKIISYEQSGAPDEALLVADANDGFDFEQATAELRSLIPVNLRVTQVNRGRVDTETAKNNLLDGIHRGQKLVNYTGHGSVDFLRANLLDNAAARALNNEHLPVFVMMTCLSGYFHDPALDSLAESLMKAERGGAVAVWASSGMTPPNDQALMNREFYRLVFGNPSLTLGEAARRAKLAVSDSDVRRTWVFLGDPAMKLR